MSKYIFTIDGTPFQLDYSIAVFRTDNEDIKLLRWGEVLQLEAYLRTFIRKALNSSKQYQIGENTISVVDGKFKIGPIILEKDACHLTLELIRIGREALRGHIDPQDGHSQPVNI